MVNSGRFTVNLSFMPIYEGGGVPVEFGNDLREMGGQLLSGLLGDAAETESRSFLRVPDGVVVGQVHEFVDEIRLVQIGGQRAEFPVRRQLTSVSLSSWKINFKILKILSNPRK